MIRLAFDLGLLRMLRVLSIAQWSLRISSQLAVVACLIAMGHSAVDGVAAFWLVVVVICSAWMFFSVDSTAPAVTIASLGLGWWTQVDHPSSGWLLVFALGVFAIHTSAALTSSGPPSAPIGSDTLRRWSMAASSVAFVAVLAWGMFVAMNDVSMRASTLRLVAALVAVALLTLAIRRLSLPTAPGESADLGRGADRP